MRCTIKYMLLLLTCVLSAGCEMTLHETDICDYTVLLHYDYNEENTSKGRNMILSYVTHIDELIFDEEGVLVNLQRIEPDECRDYLDSEVMLPPGRYSVIAIGNIDHRSDLHDDALGNLKVGATRREDLRLSLDNAEELADGTHNNSEKLYHAYHTFIVREEGISRIRVNMINAHMELRFRVTWKRNTPSRTDSYYAILETIPSEYNIMPEYIYPAGSFDAVLHEPTSHDAYPHTDNNVIHHIPHTCHADNNILSHSNTSFLNADGEVRGTFVNYRIKTATDPVLTLYFAPDGVRSHSTDPMVLPREIRLSEYFSFVGQRLDHELKQEYAIDITVEGDRIKITPLDDFSIADWNDGGHY